MVVRHDGLEGRPGLDALAADHERDVDPLARHLREPLLELGALRAARRVPADRLVDGGRRAEDPGGAHGADCRVGWVDVTRDRDAVRHRYEVPGWGVGELVVRDGVLVAHALPSRRRKLFPAVGGPQGGASTPEVTLARKPSQVGDGFVPDLCRRFASAPRRDAGRATTTSSVDDAGLSGFQRELLARDARPIGWGDVVSYGGLAALAGRPRAARAAGSFCAAQPLLARRPVPPRRRRRTRRAVRARRIRAVRSAPQATAARARGDAPVSIDSLAADARAELAAVAPTRRCDRLAELSALFHTGRHRPPPRPRRGLVPPRPRRVGGRAPRVRDPPRASGRLGDPDVPASRLRRASRDAAPRRRLGARDRRAGAGRASSSREGLPLDRPPGRVVARPCCRSAYLRGAFLGAGSLSGPRSPHLEVRTPLHAGAAFVRSVASAAGIRMRVIDRESHSAAYAKSWDGDRGVPVGRRRVRDRARARGAGPRRRAAGRREPAGERGSREPRPPEPLRPGAARGRADAARLGRARATSRPTLQDAAELRLRHPSLSLRELGGAGGPTADEGRDGGASRAPRRVRGRRPRAGSSTRRLSYGTAGPIIASRWAALPGGGSRPRSPSGLGARIGGGDLLGAPPPPTLVSRSTNPRERIRAADPRLRRGTSLKASRFAGRNCMPRRAAMREPSRLHGPPATSLDSTRTHSRITEASDAWQPGSASTASAGSAATSSARSSSAGRTSRSSRSTTSATRRRWRTSSSTTRCSGRSPATSSSATG